MQNTWSYVRTQFSKSNKKMALSMIKAKNLSLHRISHLELRKLEGIFQGGRRRCQNHSSFCARRYQA